MFYESESIFNCIKLEEKLGYFEHCDKSMFNLDFVCLVYLIKNFPPLNSDIFWVFYVYIFVQFCALLDF